MPRVGTRHVTVVRSEGRILGACDCSAQRDGQVFIAEDIFVKTAPVRNLPFGGPVGDMIDPLTGELNRRGFTEAVERELARAGRYERPFVLAYIDVRGLKRVNDSEGHLAGDQVLKAASAALRRSIRAHDVVVGQQVCIP